MTSSTLPRTLYTAAAVRAMDACAINDHEIPGALLMKRAGRVCFDALQQHFSSLVEIVVFCGGGNNGGDGYVVAGLARAAGFSARVIHLCDPDWLQGDAQRAYQFALQEGVPCAPFDEDTALPGEGVVVDALLGTGLKGQPNSLYSSAIDLINASGLPVLAVDIPSGLDADTGQCHAAVIQAQVTCTFIGLKMGLFTCEGPNVTGRVIFDHLDVPPGVLSSQRPVAERLHLADLLTALPSRAKTAHKGDFGHSLIVGGDLGFGGAAIMCAEACARMGSGLTSLATRPENVTAVNVRVPEVMSMPVLGVAEMEALISRATVICVGPGLGRLAWGEQLLLSALMAQKPLVIDADGLNLIASGIGSRVLAQRDETIPLILTPHPGEAARLLNKSNGEIQNDRLAAVTAIAERFKATVLLKGAGSLIASPGAGVTLCDDGNPGMASGGMGDVLAGMVTGLLAQKMESVTALQLAVSLHANAADELAQKYGERGLLATDLIGCARALVNGC